MTGLLRRATFLAMGGVLVAGMALAAVPSSTTSTQPSPRVVTLVGRVGAPDMARQITYTIRDGQTVPQPVPNSVVILNFSACGDIRICQSDVSAGLTTNCGAKTVSGVTNGAGQITFAISGAGNGVGAPTNSNCVTVTADGVPMNTLNAVTVDYNGINGVDGIDGGAFASDLFGYPGIYRARSDYDDDGDIDGIDGGAWASVLFAGGSQLSCTTLCP